jgi:GrpB-like predicted nucleotidyltransferase (UPF0157 family)
MRQVTVVSHQPQWSVEFEREAKAVSTALGKNVLAIHHIGSTAIPGIYAKPIIDLLVAVQDLLAVDQKNAAMESLGYEAMGEFGIIDRRFFRKDDMAGIRTHHVHVFANNSPQISRHLAFRDYLIAHPASAQQYSDLKRALAKQYPQDIQGYMDGKDGFIQEIDRRAAQWSTPAGH